MFRGLDYGGRRDFWLAACSGDGSFHVTLISKVRGYGFTGIRSYGI